MTKPEQCKEAGQACGSPAGWRKGGRCPRCRAAHNEETNRYRGLRPEERTEVLRLLRAGITSQEAAAAVGKTATALSASAGRDGELRAALDGAPIAQQRMARLGDYLSALTRHRGDAEAAMAAIGASSEEAEQWAALPGYGRVEAALQVMLRGIGSVKIRTKDAEEFAAMWEAGIPSAAIAEQLGVTLSAVRGRAAYMGLPLRQAPKQRVTEEQRREIARLWPDERLSVREIAERLEVSPASVRMHARDMGLPRRKDGRKPAGQEEAAANEEASEQIPPDDLMPCLICGRRFQSLGPHLRSAHQMSGADYLAAHQLPASAALMDTQTRKTLSSGLRREAREAAARKAGFGSWQEAVEATQSLSSSEAAARLGVGKSTIMRWRQRDADNHA
jgi:DNA-binding CsgD family transcriptional regulator/predicted transcriptional regulator